MTQAAAAKQAEIPTQMYETSYFVIMDDDFEKKAAREYVKNKYPGTQARVVSELRLDRLTDRHTVYALFRGNERTPALQQIANINGIRELKPTPVAELAGEVIESRPIRVADYWSQGRDSLEGELDESTFLSELGKKCSPAAIKYYPQQRLLKLGFG